MNWLIRTSSIEHKWYHIDDPLVTLYHATSSILWQKIKDEGLKPPNVQDIVNEVIISSGFSPEEVPNWIKSEVELRQNSKVHWGLSPKTAEGYATYVGFGGEIAYSTYNKLKAWAEENHLPFKPRSQEKTIIIRGDIPRDLVYVTWRRGRENHDSVKDYFPEILKRVKNVGMTELDVDEILSGAEFITGPIPPNYLTVYS